MVSYKICEECGKRKKRYRVAFSSWICDNCKKETSDYDNGDAFIRIEVNNWWANLTKEQKTNIYLKNKD